MLAYHWLSALDLARASGLADAPSPTASVSRADAGDRAFALNSFAVAAAQYEDALALWPGDDPDRPDPPFRFAQAVHWAYDDRQQAALETARDALLESGDSEHAAEAEVFLARMFWDRGDGATFAEHVARAEALAGNSSSASSARVLAQSARFHTLSSRSEEALPIARAALAIADELGLEGDPRACAHDGRDGEEGSR